MDKIQLRFIMISSCIFQLCVSSPVLRFDHFHFLAHFSEYQGTYAHHIMKDENQVCREIKQHKGSKCMVKSCNMHHFLDKTQKSGVTTLKTTTKVTVVSKLRHFNI